MQKYVIALYIRLSLEDYKYDSMSIENQHLALNEFVSSMPESANAEVLEFIDNGYSGTNFERPKVQELIEMVRANKIDCIIVKDFSRFGRNSIETGYFIERVFPLFHTRFISINDDFDSDQHKGDTGGMDVAFKYLISEYYSWDMSIKTKSAKYAKMQRGEYQSKICPYGYRKGESGRMEPDPEAAEVVRLIFRLAVGGMTAAAITRELYKQGVPTPGEYKAAHGNTTYDISRTHGIWSSSSVLRILEDERYIGTYVMGKRKIVEVGSSHVRMKDQSKWFVIPDHHQAIVDKETFQQAQDAITHFSQPVKKRRDYPLRGKVFCGCCGHALTLTGEKNPYYFCRQSQVTQELPCCATKVNAIELQDAVLDVLKKQADAVLDDGKDIASSLSSLQSREYEYKAQQSALLDGKRALYEQFLLGELDLASYKEKKAALDDQLVNLDNSHATLKAQMKLAEEQEERHNLHHAAEREILKAERINSTLENLLIDKVLVFPDKRIKLCYKVENLFAPRLEVSKG